MKSKYIVIEQADREFMIIFPDSPLFFHSRMSEAVKRIKAGRGDNRSPFKFAHIVSAGFVMRGRCFGRSESLGIDSRPDIDTLLLKTQMGIE